MNKTSIIFISILVIAAALVIYVLDASNDGPAYASFSTGNRGTSLLFDTLQHMGYPVRTGYRPLNRDSNQTDVYIIIQPHAPSVNRQMAGEMLDWVREGGRLIFLHNTIPNIMDIMLPGSPQRVDGLAVYQWGFGEVVTGRASYVTNQNIMSNPAMGEALQAVLSGWDSSQIWFAEYYHGFHASDNLLQNLPLIVRLLLAQLALVAIAAVIHLGKRYGNLLPLYEEVELEENEHVRALARLYSKVRKQ